MASPVEQTIQEEFESKLDDSNDVNQDLRNEIVALFKNEKLPSVDSLVTLIKENSGDATI
ncbi:hypothetical protein [Specibacter sp. NPDC078692]|uniref:hypothetical protein n=1 Tax=Specibacter sp. NPDC078692 TaxID=3155818 RepID=UPI00342DA127